MNGPPESVKAIEVLVLAATLAPWVWIVRRLIARRPVLPYQPRRPVPWGALDVVLVVFFFIGAAGFVYLCERPLLDDWAQAHYGAKAPDENSQVGHSLFHVLAANPYPLTLALCVFSAVVAAPIAEEFFFRLMLQGWLEKVERRLRRPMPAVRRLAPGVLPIAIASAVFALPHYRSAPPDGPPPDVVTLFHILVVNGVASLMAVGFGVVLVTTRTRATSEDLGFVPAKLWPDVRLGLVAALAVVGPVELLQYLVQRFVMPNDVAADPVSIFFFSAVLGALYCRTHRIVPGITVHMALNLTSLTLAWVRVST